MQLALSFRYLSVPTKQTGLCASAPLREDPFALFIIHYTDTADKRNVAYEMQRYTR